MSVQSLTLVAVGTALLAPATAPAAAHPQEPVRAEGSVHAGGGVRAHGSVRAEGSVRADRSVRAEGSAAPAGAEGSVPAEGSAAPADAEGGVPAEGSVRAADLLAKLRECSPVSQGYYRPDTGARADIPVCGTPEAVFWKADMDIDCDGRPGPRCNSTTDPWFQPTTAYQQSDGRYLNAETLPFIVVPAPSHIWDYSAHGVRGGSVVAVIHQDRVQYAVVGDTGPQDTIGEASYATAKALGIRPDPGIGGTNDEVTYLVFKDTRVTPIEDHEEAAAQGEALARRFVAAK